MSDTQAKTVASQDPVTAETQPEIESDNEPMDQETLQALKNCSINDEIAAADFTKKEKKIKNTKKNKKANTKKQDFLDLAQEKGIELKIQYEDKEEAKKNYYQRDNANTNYHYQNNQEQKYQRNKFYEKPYNKDNSNDQQNSTNNNQTGYYKKNYYNKSFNKYSGKNFHFQAKPKNNKFDQVNNMMYNPLFNQMRPGMVSPYQMPNYSMNQHGHHAHHHAHAQHELNTQDPAFATDKTLEEILAYVFSPEFLNKEVYFRKRISPEGSIDLNHFLNYNKVKARNVTVEQVKEALANLNPPVLEFFEAEGKNYLKICDWENLQQTLMTVDQIQSQKRALKIQKYSNTNYIALQNNYFFPPNNSYQAVGQMPGMGGFPMMEHNPYMMPHVAPQMGQMNMPFQHNFIPGMTQQFQQPPQEEPIEQTPQDN